MDDFFQRLREIQKKERNISGLAGVGNNFYKDVYNYLDTLIRKIDNNPFSFESYLLRDTQRIVTEIFERREHKITKSAVMNVQRSYQLFKEKSYPDFTTTIPLNSTPEEKKLYHALVDSLLKYRKKMILPLKSSISSQKREELQIQSAEESKAFIDMVEDQRDRKLDIGVIEEDLEGLDGKKEFKPVKIREKSSIRTLMILEELPSIIGIDKKVYGPVSPQDVITIPEPNAKILIKNNKGKFIQSYK